MADELDYMKNGNLRLVKRLEWLRPIFAQFNHNLNTYYGHTGRSDLPHYYNERATLSVLAAAAWQTGAVALEEFVGRKDRWNRQVEKKPGNNGRTDLFIGGRQWSAVFEAKQYFSRPGVYEETVYKWLEDSDRDARRNHDGDYRIGLTFLVPDFDASVSEEGVCDAVERTINPALTRGIDGFHYWLPEDGIRNTRHPYEGREWCRPVLITLLRIATVRGAPQVRKGDRLVDRPLALAPMEDA